MIIHNLFVLFAGEPRSIDSSADGNGISLTISKHYRTEREQDLKDKKDRDIQRTFCH